MTLGSAATVVSLFGHTGVSLKMGSNESVQVTIFSDSRLHDGKTVITIMHMKKNPS